MPGSACRRKARALASVTGMAQHPKRARELGLDRGRSGVCTAHMAVVLVWASTASHVRSRSKLRRPPGRPGPARTRDRELRARFTVNLGAIGLLTGTLPDYLVCAMKATMTATGGPEQEDGLE